MGEVHKDVFQGDLTGGDNRISDLVICQHSSKLLRVHFSVLGEQMHLVSQEADLHALGECFKGLHRVC